MFIVCSPPPGLPRDGTSGPRFIGHRRRPRVWPPTCLAWKCSAFSIVPRIFRRRDTLAKEWLVDRRHQQGQKCFRGFVWNLGWWRGWRFFGVCRHGPFFLLQGSIQAKPSRVRQEPALIWLNIAPGLDFMMIISLAKDGCPAPLGGTRPKTALGCDAARDLCRSGGKRHTLMALGMLSRPACPRRACDRPEPCGPGKDYTFGCLACFSVLLIALQCGPGGQIRGMQLIYHP